MGALALHYKFTARFEEVLGENTALVFPLFFTAYWFLFR